MAGQVQHTFAAFFACQKILVAVEQNISLDIFLRVSGQARELRSHAAQVAHHPTRHRFAFFRIPIRERQPQIKFRGLAQLGQQGET